jgi:predicted RNase H-like HicB family nuclease
MYRFLVVIEKANGNYSAYSPDLPGCVATGKTKSETERRMHEAIQFHIQGLKEEGMPIPQTKAIAEYIAITARELKATANSG